MREGDSSGGFLFEFEGIEITGYGSYNSLSFKVIKTHEIII